MCGINKWIFFLELSLLKAGQACSITILLSAGYSIFLSSILFSNLNAQSFPFTSFALPLKVQQSEVGISIDQLLIKRIMAKILFLHIPACLSPPNLRSLTGPSTPGGDILIFFPALNNLQKAERISIKALGALSMFMQQAEELLRWNIRKKITINCSRREIQNSCKDQDSVVPEDIQTHK